MQLSGVAYDRCQTCFQNQSEKMVWISEENAVGLRFGEGQSADDLANTTHIVTLVGIEGREHLIGSQRHWREELYAVVLSLTREQHHPIVEPVGSLLRRQAGNVGGASA